MMVMKTDFRKIMLILPVVCLLAGCSYNETPPMTDDASTQYVLPQGEVPTPEEVALVQAVKDAYEESINN